MKDKKTTSEMIQKMRDDDWEKYDKYKYCFVCKEKTEFTRDEYCTKCDNTFTNWSNCFITPRKRR